MVASSRPCPEAGACLPSWDEEERECFPTQTLEIQRHHISLLAPWRARRSFPPKPPLREVFQPFHPHPPSHFGVRECGFGARAGQPTSQGTRSTSGVSCAGDCLPSSCGRGAEANQLFFELQNIIIPKRSCIYQGQKSLSLHIPGSGSLQDAEVAALGGEKNLL